MSKLLNSNVSATLNVFGLPHRPKDRINVEDSTLSTNESSMFHNLNFNESSKLYSNETKEDKTVDSDVESLILDLNNLGGLSSSSSLSWSDDYETETTKKVYDELKRLDRVLKGEEPIPTNYDQVECEEWMNFFSNISIFDDDKTPTNSIENLSWNKHFQIHKETPHQFDCDMNLNEKPTVMTSSSVKFLECNEKFSPNIEKRTLNGRNKLIKGNYFVTSKPKSLDIDQYLKVSPVVHNKRKQSSKSLMNRQMSRESPEHNLEYSSLPHIKIQGLPNLKVQKNSQQIRRKPYSKTSGRNNNPLILPPINIDQFRSVSAIPSENFKTLSALSITSTLKEKLNKKHSIGPVKNPISSRREKNIFLL